MSALLWTTIGFLSGSMPFSLLLGRLFARADVRDYGDGNPGATNAWRAGGWPVGVAVLLLDYVKGAAPVSLAHFVFGVSRWSLVPVALAPVLGHAFSPFLRLQGGKAVAVTFGIWTGLTLGEAPLLLGILVSLFFLIQTADAWAVILSMGVFLAHLALRQASPTLIAIWAGNALILLWKHRAGLRQIPQPRAWVGRLVKRER
ncbi:MAG: glycerol-3-phosphate acyltransferase [Anaerolineae bacterium]|nr:glycerol-3-phosphate acyltransferase [Anaerolineae bacterium]